MTDEKLEEKVRIDPSTFPHTPQNIDAAKKLGIKYVRYKNKFGHWTGCYVDVYDGCPVRDEYGQELG